MEDYSGRGQYLAKTKGEISHAKTRSKIGQQGVLKEEDESLPLFLWLWVWRPFVLGAEVEPAQSARVARAPKLPTSPIYIYVGQPL